MEVNTFLAIENRLNCNDTIDEQRKYVPLIIDILKINQEVIIDKGCLVSKGLTEGNNLYEKINYESFKFTMDMHDNTGAFCLWRFCRNW